MGKERDWKPARRGKTYCSPACGMGCTETAHCNAVNESKALAKRMGKGWKPRVWENLGWHYAVTKGKPQGVFGNGFLEITPPSCKGDTYTAWIQTHPQFIVSHKDPKTALALAVKGLDKHIAHLMKSRKLVDETLEQEK
jgi:hypothetical protein